MEFANLLTDKLQRVLEAQAHSEMFRCKLNAMSEVGTNVQPNHVCLRETGLIPDITTQYILSVPVQVPCC